MKREQIIAALPCYVCGDLPESVSQAIAEQLQRDPELRALALELQDTQDECRERSEQEAPEQLQWREVPAAAGAKGSLLLKVVVASLVGLLLLWGLAKLLLG